MDKLWLLMAAVLPMAWLIDQRDLINKARGIPHHERFVTFLMIIVMTFFCGLRIWGNDTITYIQIYEHLTPPIDEFIKSNSITYAQGLGFAFTNSVLKSLQFTTQDYLMFYAFLTTTSFVLFARRYSSNLVMGIFLMLTTGLFTFSMAAIKQTTATGICLWAIPFALDRKWTRFFLIVGLASLFHPYALVYLLVPFMIFEPWKGRTVLYIIIFVTVGFALDTLVGTLVDITTMMGANYSAEQLTGEGVNLFRVGVCLVPMVLAVFYGGELFRSSSRTEWLMFNLSMINGLIMFVGLFGTANYFARLANYFLPTQMVTLQWLICSAHVKDRRWLIPTSVIGYLGYFIYENAIIHPFDSRYAHISLTEYLADLFSRTFP